MQADFPPGKRSPLAPKETRCTSFRCLPNSSGWISSRRQPFLPENSTNMKACLRIGLYRGETMMLNPVDGEAGPLCEGDQLILLRQTLPDLSQIQIPVPKTVAS